ncbi:DNA repair protein XRCC1 [Pelomyxa schiedti]|nr:DNA repair protein XRCC1 [Pelomyxa schiedti]
MASADSSNNNGAEFRITGCSSESPSHPARNVTTTAHERQWLTSARSEALPDNQATLDLAFAEPTVVRNVDIGNAGSEFVEVLVYHPPAKGAKPSYKVILRATAFISPQEAKEGTNRDRVKFFGLDKLTKPICNEKWEYVHVVCSSRYRHDKPLGLCFIRFNVDQTAQLDKASSSTSVKTTSITHPLSPEKPKPQSNVLKPSMPQLPGVREQQSPRPKSVAQLRTSSDSGEDTDDNGMSSCLHPIKTPKPENVIIIPAMKKPPSQVFKKETIPLSHSQPQVVTEVATLERKSCANPKSTIKEEVITPVTVTTRQGNSLEKESALPFKGLVIAISGIENPERATLREKIVAMGGSYTNNCEEATHLICEFSATPKYREMIARGGAVVMKQWIYDSSSVECKLNESDYQLQEEANTWGQEEEKEEDTEPELYNTRSKAPNNESLRTQTSDVTQQKKIPKSVSTSPTKKKKKLKAGEDPDSEYESSGPDEYDTRDSFIDTRSTQEIEQESILSGSSDGLSDEDNDLRFNEKHVEKHHFEEFPRTPSSKKPRIEHKELPKAQDTLGGLPHPSKEKRLPPPSTQNRSSNVDMEDTDFIAMNLIRAMSSTQKSSFMNDDPEVEPVPQITKAPEIRNHPPSSVQPTPDKFVVPPEISIPSSDDTPSVQLDKLSLIGHPGPLKPLPDFFTGVQAFLTGEISDDLRNSLYRYLLAYNGEVLDYLLPGTTHVITTASWDDTFDDAKQEHPELLIVKPEWVLKCHSLRKRIEVDNFLVSKG